MDFWVLFVVMYSFIFSGVIGYPLNDQIGTLPGQPIVNFRQFSGYIDVDPEAGRSLFYYFVEAENDPKNQPLTIWLTGGPGCSSVGDSFVGVGPFITTNDARGLERNPHAWNNVSNILFIDSPVGAGWSYSNTSDDYIVGDHSTNNDLVTFILKWFEKYPIFKSRDLYVCGASYAGHFVPNFVNSLLQYNKQSMNFKFNIKGLALGNPVLRYKLDLLAEQELYASEGMISRVLHQQILKRCNGVNEDNYSNNVGPWSESCQQAMGISQMIAFNVTSVDQSRQRQFDISRTPCDGTMEDLKSGKEITKVIDGCDLCLTVRPNFYFNIPEVQKVFHANRTNLKFEWSGCIPMSGLKYNPTDIYNDMLPTLKQILQQSVPITIFSGDVDGAIPLIGNSEHVKKLAKDMNMNLTKNETWNHENKEGGLLYLYGDLLTFMTVKGANHHVPLSRPSQALYIFSNFVIN
ncbi:serine carboxypeptidase-like 44 isoform X2 [Hibiscus syriacus]|nr:serine carboxypeptidase-like 44 isoform X2 [Hibiscus syriacus]